ncbi:MAG: type II toxin-antitoxin system VapB family antitoxin [Candidatus Hydrogenedentota bacterium]
MQTAKIFRNGRSQAIRLPKEFRFEGSDVYIKKFEDIVILIPKNNPWKSLINSLNKFTDDFMINRNNLKLQLREEI